MSAPGPEWRSVVRWWPLEFHHVGRDRRVLRWFHHHFATTASLVRTPPLTDPPAVPGTAAARSPAQSPTRAGAVTGPDAYRRVVVRSVADDREARSASRAVEASAERRVQAYVGEWWHRGAVDARPAWSLDVPADQHTSALVVRSDDTDRWTVLAGSAADLARGTVRLGRELVRTELAARGAITLHAATAISARFGGLLLLGPSGAGKTTLSLAIGRDGFLSSGDQTEVVATATGTPLAVGFPWVGRIGAGTLTRFDADHLVETAPLHPRGQAALHHAGHPLVGLPDPGPGPRQSRC